MLILVVNLIPPYLYFVQINLIKYELAEIPNYLHSWLTATSVLLYNIQITTGLARLLAGAVEYVPIIVNICRTALKCTQ